MSWATISVKDWVNRVSAAFEAWLPGVDARLARNNLGPTATAIGGALWQLDAKLEEVARDRFVHLARADALERHGADFGLPRHGASFATGLVTITAAEASIVEVGALLRRADGTRLRVTSAGASTGAGIYTVSAAATLAGTAGNSDGSTPLTVLSGIIGSVTPAVEASGLSGGAEVEEIEVYRARLLQRLAYPPQGGTTSDYWRWATSVPGCTGCFVWPRRGGPGRVTIYPIFDGLRPDGRPSAGDLALVRETIEPWIPDGAIVTVTAFTPRRIDVAIPSLSPSSRAVKDAIAAELANIFAARSRVAGLAEAHPSLPMRATFFVWPRAWIEEAISRAVGEARHGPTTPATDTVLAPGERAILGNISFGP